MSNNSKILIIPAAGIGSRMSSEIPKQYIKLINNLTILDNTLSKFVEENYFDEIIIALNENDILWSQSIYYSHSKIKTCIGGNSRSESVYNAIKSIENNCCDNHYIFVHDAARPFMDISYFNLLINQMINTDSDAAILAINAFETVKKVHGDSIVETIDRDNVWLAQTPQLSSYKNMVRAFEYCRANLLTSKVTDESSAIEMSGMSSVVVKGPRYNIKITTPEDLEYANFILSC